MIDRARKNHEQIHEGVIWNFFTQILEGLYECHNHEKGTILHRDLKPSNIFLNKDKLVKIGDFGLSKQLSAESNCASTNVGTPYYMSPEQIDSNFYNEKSDIWALGCILYELCELRPPFKADNYLDLAKKIHDGSVRRIKMMYSDDLDYVIKKMLDTNPKQRPSVSDLLTAPQVDIRI